MFRTVVPTALTVLMFTATLAAETHVSTIKLQGTIPQAVSVTVNDLDNNSSKLIFGEDGAVTSVQTTHFEDGSFEVPEAVTLSNIYTNVPVFLRLRNKGWTVPATYNTANGTKSADGNDAQLLLKVRRSQKDEGILEVVGNFDTEYGAIGKDPVNVLKLGGIDSQGKYTGLRNGQVQLDTKIVLDPIYDVPGHYSVELEITVAEQI